MIIVSQDKDKIINFDNTTRIRIGKYNGEVYIQCDFQNGSYEDLGIYKTEERAKEVLQEIANTYSIIGLAFEELNGGSKQRVPIYEMPED